jgi:hypothetical protein
VLSVLCQETDINRSSKPSHMRRRSLHKLLLLPLKLTIISYKNVPVWILKPVHQYKSELVWIFISVHPYQVYRYLYFKPVYFYKRGPVNLLFPLLSLHTGTLLLPNEWKWIFFTLLHYIWGHFSQFTYICWGKVIIVVRMIEVQKLSPYILAQAHLFTWSIHMHYMKHTCNNHVNTCKWSSIYILHHMNTCNVHFKHLYCCMSLL